MILGCETSINQNLDEKKEVQANSESEPTEYFETAVKTNAATEASAYENLSGTYISEITNNHPWYFTKSYQNFILSIEQNGNQITAIDSTSEIKIAGILEGDVIDFEVFGDDSASYPFGNVVYGEWSIKNSNTLEGRWWAAGHNAGGKWDLIKLEEEKIELYTIETGLERPFKLTESNELFDMIFSLSGNKNIVFYIHGRGQDFKTDFDSSMIPFVENYSDTRFVIIRWLSWGDSSTRPYQHAVDSALGVSKLLLAFNDYKVRNPDKVGNRRITLLAHSMGNIPLRIFLEEFYEKGGLQKSLFSSAILNSADVPRIAHREWIEKLDFADNIYIIQHRRDLVLHLSNLFFQDDAEEPGPRLGTSFGTRNQIEDLASNVRYLDITLLNNSIHRHFNLPSNPEATRLFKLLLNGEDINYPDSTIGLTERSDQAPIFYFYSEEQISKTEK